jgi:hypothetical protein
MFHFFATKHKTPSPSTYKKEHTKHHFVQWVILVGFGLSVVGILLPIMLKYLSLVSNQTLFLKSA